MKKITYKQAYDKIIEAYFKDEIHPLWPTHCICGTLNSNDPSYWSGYESKENGHFYKGIEFQQMEVALLSTMDEILMDVDIYGDDSDKTKQHPEYENALFAGMCAALDTLKEIHRSRGENVDEVLTPFTKRNLTIELANQ